MKNEFLDLAAEGHNQVWRYILTVFLIIVAAFGAQIVVLIPIMLAQGTLDLNTLDSLTLLVATMAPFPVAMVVLLVCVRWLHGRSPITLMTPTRRINWKKLTAGAAVWFGLCALSDVVLFLINPSNYTWSLDLKKFIPYFLVSLLLIPLQTSTEELIFRGYLAQWIGRYTRSIFLPLLIPAFIFMLLHGANPEVLAYGAWLTLPFYFGIGLLLGWITLRSQSLELALGVHLANNLYSSLVVTFPNSALPSPAFFNIKAYDSLAGLISFLVMAALFLVIFYTQRKRWLAVAPLTAILLLALLAPVRPVSADSGYEAQNWRSQIEIQADGSLLVTETVAYANVDAATTYATRELPLTTADAIEIVAASLNGVSLDFGTQAGQVDVENTGDTQVVTWLFAQPPAETFELTLQYHVLGGLRQNSSGDMLEWIVIPEDHEYSIAAARIELAAPQGILPVEAPTLTGFTSEATAEGDRSVFTLVSVPANQAVTLRATYPAGSLVQTAPQWQQTQRLRSQALLDALPAALAALIGLVVLTIAGLEWLRRKSETRLPMMSPASKPVLSAALAGCVVNGARFTIDHWFAAVVEAAQRGNLALVECELGGYFGGHDYRMTPGPEKPVSGSFDQALLRSIFTQPGKKKDESRLYQPARALAKKVNQLSPYAQQALIEAGLMDADRLLMRSRLTQAGTGLTMFGLFLAAAGTILVSVGSSWLIPMAVVWIGAGFGAALSGAVCSVYASLWKVLSPLGMSEQETWQAERDRLKQLIHSRIPLDAAWMERDFALAIAMGLGADWVKTFQDQGLPVELDWVQTDQGTPASGLSLAAVITAAAAPVAGSLIENDRPFLNFEMFRKSS